jgi:hypothetical protein
MQLSYVFLMSAEQPGDIAGHPGLDPLLQGLLSGMGSAVRYPARSRRSNRQRSMCFCFCHVYPKMIDAMSGKHIPSGKVSRGRYYAANDDD